MPSPRPPAHPTPPCTPDSAGNRAPSGLSREAVTIGFIGLVIVVIIVITLPVASVWLENYAKSIQIRDLPRPGRGDWRRRRQEPSIGGGSRLSSQNPAAFSLCLAPRKQTRYQPIYFLVIENTHQSQPTTVIKQIMPADGSIVCKLRHGIYTFF